MRATAQANFAPLLPTGIRPLDKGGNKFGHPGANSNVSGDGQSSYGWNARGELASISGSSGASFGYDAFGRRVRKTLAGATTRFLDDGDNVVQELSDAGAPSANLLTAWGSTRPSPAPTRTERAALLTDALGSTLALTVPSGAATTESTYEPFGKATATGSSDGNAFQYTGRENDGALSYYRARY